MFLDIFQTITGGQSGGFFGTQVDINNDDVIAVGTPTLKKVYLFKLEPLSGRWLSFYNVAGEAFFPQFSDNLLTIVRTPRNLITVHNVTTNGISAPTHNFTTNMEVTLNWDVTAEAVVVGNVGEKSREGTPLTVYPMKNGVEEQTLQQSWQGAGTSSGYGHNVIMMDKVRNFAYEFSSQLSNKRRGRVDNVSKLINGRGKFKIGNSFSDPKKNKIKIFKIERSVPS